MDSTFKKYRKEMSKAARQVLMVRVVWILYSERQMPSSTKGLFRKTCNIGTQFFVQQKVGTNFYVSYKYILMNITQG